VEAAGSEQILSKSPTHIATQNQREREKREIVVFFFFERKRSRPAVLPWDTYLHVIRYSSIAVLFRAQPVGRAANSWAFASGIAVNSGNHNNRKQHREYNKYSETFLRRSSIVERSRRGCRRRLGGCHGGYGLAGS
jgi:hypothetical protein